MQNLTTILNILGRTLYLVLHTYIHVLYLIYLFVFQVLMWVFEEIVDGRKLSEIINEKHENVKYLPGVKLPENVVSIIVS